VSRSRQFDMTNAGLLAAAATFYMAAAWMVTPGFYDGFPNPQQYNFVCPPPQAGANLPPKSGHTVIKVINGVSDANSAFTDDAQVVVGFLPGAFDATGKSSITVDIKPVRPCPAPKDLVFSTNTYEITADAPLIKAATLVMPYSNLVLDPSFLYRAPNPDGSWTKIDLSPQAQVWTINAKVKEFGYFAAGYPTNAVSHAAGTDQILPVTVAVLILAVLLGGIPLAILRRRRAAGGAAVDDGTD
jgi:hypothetical protein